ncbi:MAG: hypothetical protein QOJ74_2240, partial [Ilumatobacteraceae bacterium]|nr:hypothetical protein [Ilumatobacteraceae bacterium]
GSALRATHRLTAAALVVSMFVVTVACTSGTSSKPGSSASTPSGSASAIPSTGSTDGVPSASSISPSGSADGTTTATALQALVGAGIQIVKTEEEPAQPDRVIRITEVQARRLVADLGPGAGVLGRDIDSLAAMPAGSPPTSYLVAAWVSTGKSDAASAARGWMGVQNWKDAPNLHFPLAVVAMFVSEMATVTNTQMPADAAAPSTGSSQPASSIAPNAFRSGLAYRSLAPCSIVTGFLASVIQGLFGALRITPSSGSGFFDFLASALATVWNVAVGLAQGVVEGLVQTLTAPVFQAIRLAVGALGVATIVISYFKDQTLNVDLAVPQTDPGQYPFAVGAGADITGRFVATGRELTGDWPPALIDCAKTAGATLPELLKPGIPATWTVDDGGVIVPGSLTGSVDADRKATLSFVTGRESEEEAKGDSVIGDAIATVKIPRSEVSDFLALATAQVTGARAQLMGAIPAGAARTAADSLFASTIDPTTKRIADEVAGAVGGVFTLSGSAIVVVLHHTPPDTTTSSPPTSAPSDTNPGDFCRQYKDMLDWNAANQPGDVTAWANELVRRLDALRPAAPGELVADVDIELGVYTAVAAAADVRVLIARALPLQGASSRIATYCGLG